jgi:putative sterol carrier protein
MTDASAEFFDELGQRGHEPFLEHASGTIGFELKRGNRTERWVVAVNKGDIAVSRKKADCDCVFRTDLALFDRVVAGETNMLAALLRGTLAVDGDPTVAVLFQRLLPRPSGDEGSRHTAGYARRQR